MADTRIATDRREASGGGGASNAVASASSIPTSLIGCRWPKTASTSVRDPQRHVKDVVELIALGPAALAVFANETAARRGWAFELLVDVKHVKVSLNSSNPAKLMLRSDAADDRAEVKIDLTFASAELARDWSSALKKARAFARSNPYHRQLYAIDLLEGRAARAHSPRAERESVAEAFQRVVDAGSLDVARWQQRVELGDEVFTFAHADRTFTQHVSANNATPAKHPWDAQCRLRKQGHVVKNWKWRDVHVSCTTGMLEYRDGSETKGSIDLRRLQSVHSERKGGHPFCFRLDCDGGKTLVIEASSLAERDLWMNRVRLAAKFSQQNAMLPLLRRFVEAREQCASSSSSSSSSSAGAL